MNLPSLLPTLFLLLAHVAFAQVEYTVREIRPSGAIRTSVADINDRGEVAGYYETGVINQAFVDREGALTLLPPLPGFSQSVASGINATGQVSGTSTDAGGFNQACRWTDGIPLNIGALAPGQFSFGLGINGAGDLIGTGRIASGAQRAFLYSNGASAPLDLGTLGGEVSSAAAVNGIGTVVGRARIANGETRAFSYLNGSPMTDLGTLGGNYSEAHGINARGDIVGQARIASGNTRAFLLSPGGVMTNLGFFAGGSFSVAQAVNVRGEIVGQANSATRAALAFHFVGGRLRDLNKLVSLPGGSLDNALAINSTGRIAVQGRMNGMITGFVLTPIAPAVTLRGSRRFSTNRRQITLRGTATGMILSMQVRSGNREQPVTGTSVWKSRVRLRPGRNVIKVFALGPASDSRAERVIIVRR